MQLVMRQIRQTSQLRQSFSQMISYKLPELKYGYGDLEPVMSPLILEFHHKKHHQAYINNLNKAQDDLVEAIEKNDSLKIVQLQKTIQFNLGGHHNHSIFWENLAPIQQGGGKLPADSSNLTKAVNNVFGSYDKFISEFSAKTAVIQGSGWGWLGVDKQNKQLKYLDLSNQDIPELNGITPILTVDVWEHAYWYDYKNVRPDYLKNIWKIINWKEVERRYEAAITK